MSNSKANRILKRCAIAIVLILIIAVLCYLIFCHFEKLDYDVNEITHVELILDGDFDITTVTDKDDIAMLLTQINSCKTAAPRIAIPSAGYWVYTIRFHFEDGSQEDFAFVPYETDTETRISKMSKLGRPGWGDGNFTGTLVFDFHELAVKTNPTDGNIEWYEAVKQQH